MRRAFLLAFALSLGFVPARGATFSYSTQTDTYIGGSDTPNPNNFPPYTALTMPNGAVAWSQGYTAQNLPGKPDVEIAVTLNPQSFAVDESSTNPDAAKIYAVADFGFSVAPTMMAANLHLVVSSVSSPGQFGQGGFTVEVLDPAINTNPPFTTEFVYLRGYTDTYDLSLLAGHSYEFQAFGAPGNYSATITGTLTAVPEPAAWSLLLVGAAALAACKARR